LGKLRLDKPRGSRQRIPARTFEARHVSEVRVGDVVCFDDGFMGTFALNSGKPIVIRDNARGAEGNARKVTTDTLLVEV